MKLIRGLLLFLNAFLFMDILFICKELYLYITNISYKNAVVLTGIIFISFSIAGGLLGLIIICSKPKSIRTKCKVVKKENITGVYYFGYFSLFVLLFLSFDFGNVLNLVTFIVLFFALAFVYCRNDLYYINPTILLLGKRIYTLEVEHNNHLESVLTLTNTSIEIDTSYVFYFSPYEFTICEEIMFE